ncbi:hypothetical protein PUN28_017135 [Cardiocondyla obscurior]|uniref:Uncharacterized protein n=1 Tax=Cardiocondyla obscurior TaxID=286306 RepID=A0AAW2EP94_9HYME
MLSCTCKLRFLRTNRNARKSTQRKCWYGYEKKKEKKKKKGNPKSISIFTTEFRIFLVSRTCYIKFHVYFVRVIIKLKKSDTFCTADNRLNLPSNQMGS